MENILHWNVRGLKVLSNSYSKVKKCVSKLENVRQTFVFNIQETHLRNDEEIPAKFKDYSHLYHIISAHATEEDKGAGILLFINKTEEILGSETLYPGRLLYVKTKNISTNETRNIFSIYAKSHTSKQEIKSIMSKINDKIESDSLDHIVILGDFNYVTSIQDRNSSCFNTIDNNYRHEWNKIQVKFGLVDAFRVTNPKRRYYTFDHTNGTSHARIDRVYTSNDLMGKILSNKFEYASESDHRIVSLSLAKSVDVGPGQWIFNNTLLQDSDFVTEIHGVIDTFSDNKEDFSSKKILWEFLKQNLASSAKSYSKLKSIKEKRKIDEIRYKLEVLNSIKTEERTKSIEEAIDKLKSAENEHISKKVQGSILRSKIPGVEEGDLNLAYYSKLEKLRVEENTIFALMNNSGSLVSSTNDILDVTHKFYSELYSKEPEDTDIQDQFLSQVDVKLTDEDREKLDQDFSEKELQDALLDLKKNKSPGSDGLTKEFYDHFWDKLKILYIECLLEIEEVGELTETQKLGLIRISYKKDGRIFISNYRPITLLNVDLKILTRALAKRMISVLPKLIHENQTCVPGRRITKNIHIVQDLIDHINNGNGKGAFIFLDQEKAFDRISHKFMIKTLKAFGFGKRFINWVKIVYNNTKSAVKINGYLTPVFSIERGVRQGCPLSALLYVLCSEVLGIVIRKNVNIVGFKYNRSDMHKISQYADDMTAYIATMDSLEELFDTLRKYELATNAKLNVSKTEGLWVGEWKGREDRPLNLKWTSVSVKFTGVNVGNDRKECAKVGFSQIIEKIKLKMTYWKSKYIPLKSRVQVLNTFILAKLWYCLECQDCALDVKKDLDRLISDFIWNDIHQRELDVLYRKFEDGGLNLQDPLTKRDTLRIMWLSDVLQSDPGSIERFLVNSLMSCHPKVKGLKALSSTIHEKNISNDFYKNALKSFRMLKANFIPKDINSIRRDWIYDNTLLVNDQGDPFKAPRRFPPYAPEFFCDLPVTNNPREFKNIFKTLIPSINLSFMKLIYSDNGKDEYQFQSAQKSLSLYKASFKDIYNTLLADKKESTSIWVEKWNDSTHMGVDEWVYIWKNVHCNMLSPKVQSSAWETIHRNYMCSYFASVAFNESPMCKLCGKEELTRTHIFLDCNIILNIYDHFLSFTSRLVDIHHVNLLERAFGLKIDNPDNNSSLRNFINFSIRHIIFRNRNRKFGDPNTTTQKMIKKIGNFIQSELYTKFKLACINNKIDKFKELFLVDNILGRIESNALVLVDFD